MNREWEAFEAGYTAVRDWLVSVPDDVWTAPSVLPGWTVSDLAAHFWVIGYSTSSVQRVGPGVEPISVGEYISRYAGATDIDNVTLNAVGGRQRSIADVQQAMSAETERARSHVSGLSENQVVTGGRGPLPVSDYLRTRIIEVAVHADDIARSVPGVAPPEIPASTQRSAVRTLLDVLTQQAPGRSVEVRVPPFAAVQCVEGPRHTRGTPPNVIETDPTTWLRLATARVTWADAVTTGTVVASGDRANLDDHLPLF